MCVSEKNGGNRECELQRSSSVEAQLAESVAGQISWQSVLRGCGSSQQRARGRQATAQLLSTPQFESIYVFTLSQLPVWWNAKRKHEDAQYDASGKSNVTFCRSGAHLIASPSPQCDGTLTGLILETFCMPVSVQICKVRITFRNFPRCRGAKQSLF